MDETLVSLFGLVFRLAFGALIYWALREKYKEHMASRTPKPQAIPPQTLDDWFIEMMSQVSGDADEVAFEYDHVEATWRLYIGETTPCDETEPLWYSRDYPSITQCWKEFMLFHTKEA